MSSAPIPKQRISHVTGDIEGTIFQCRQDPGIIDRCDTPYFLSACADWPSFIIAENVTEGLKHTDAAVTGRAATQPDDEMADARFYSLCHDLPDTVRCRMQGIALFRRYQAQSGSPGHFNDSRSHVWQISIRTGYGSPQRTPDINIAELSAQSIDEGLNGSFPTVSQGLDDDLDGMTAISFADTGFNGPAGFNRRQTIFQGINGYDDFHDTLSSMCELVRLISLCL